jgi:hypothetical protein
MAQQSASSKPRSDRLAVRMSKSPPGGIAAGVVAILVMVLALAGVIPQFMFLVGAIGLIVVAYVLDKRYKALAPAQPPPTEAFAAPQAPAPTATPTTITTTGTTTITSVDVPPATPADLSSPVAPSPALLPLSDLRAEHTRLTQELTERVDDDEDVRFEKFMQLRKIEEELERQQGTPPQ